MSLESISWISEKTGFDRRTVTKRLEKLPAAVVGRAKKYETRQAFEMLYCGNASSKKDQDEQELIDGMVPLDYERWRKTKAEADSQEMKNLITQKNQAPVEMIYFAITNFAEQAKSIFESIPLKVKKKLPHLKSTEIEIIKREIVKIQNAATKITIDWSRLDELNSRKGS